jgi:hypothetical protein
VALPLRENEVGIASLDAAGDACDERRWGYTVRKPVSFTGHGELGKERSVEPTPQGDTQGDEREEEERERESRSHGPRIVPSPAGRSPLGNEVV